jgi:hypothetical protein
VVFVGFGDVRWDWDRRGTAGDGRKRPQEDRRGCCRHGPLSLRALSWYGASDYRTRSRIKGSLCSPPSEQLLLLDHNELLQGIETREVSLS